MRVVITDPSGAACEIDVEVMGVPEGEPIPDGAWGVKCDSDGKWILERIEVPEDCIKTHPHCVKLSAVAETQKPKTTEAPV